MPAAALRLVLFGPPAVETEGALALLPLERRHQLAALLALRRGWVPRSEIAALLWPEQEAKLAYANLRKTLFRLQPQAWAAGVESQAGALRFEPATDVAAFEAALADGRPDVALALYRGDLLAGFDDGQSEPWTQWLQFERERWRTAWRGTALARVPALEAAQAVALSVRLLEADPLDEAALRAHMDALARDGQAGAARQAYRRFAERLADELGVEPDAPLRAAHDALGSPTTTTRVSAPPSSAADDGFVGRGVELQRIGDLLARDECRLLCLVGPGGMGKTRLARRIVREPAARFADGAAFVELEDASTPTQFTARLAGALGLSRAVGKAPLAQIAEALSQRRQLLVLDNFEALAEHAAALLEPLLAGAPQLKLLVTSRVRVALAGVWSLPLEGLPVPDPEDDDRAEAFDAVRLFIQAAQRVEPAFDAAAERAAIVDICRQVEGLPLAIELAAAWTRVLSCRDIAAELRRGQELLRAQDAAHPARHASIGVVFDESWRRLAPVERRVLARLTVFRGGFTAEAARAVAGAVLPVLGALIDKSLLRKDGQRLLLHPLLHQLAAAKLDEDEGERAATEAAHAAHFHAWLQGLAAASAQGRRETLMAIHAEFENCRQAWTVALARGDAGTVARSSHTLLNYVENCARFDEGLVLWREATDAAPAEADVRPLLEAQAALIEMRLGRFDDAQASAERALAAAARSDREARYQALSVLGGCALSTGRFGQARRLFLRALALARALGQHAAGTLENLAIATKRLGHYEESLRLTHEALAEHRRSGDGAAEALCLSNLASLESFMDDHEAAAAHLREALALADRHCLLSTQAFARANLVEVAFKTGDMAEARAQAERALVIAEGAGIRSLAGWLQLQLAREATRRRDASGAHARLAIGIAIALALRMPWLKAAALLALAEALETRDAAADARRVLAFGADEESISVPDRDELRVEWARRAGAAGTDAPWPALTLDALLERAAADPAFTLPR